MESTEMVRLLDDDQYAGVWRVFGLDCLRAQTPTPTDVFLPYRIWLSHLVGIKCTAALVGDEALRWEEWPEKVFGQRIEVATTIYSGVLSAGSDVPDSKPLLFTEVTPRDLTSVLVDNCIPSYNALVVFLGAEREPLVAVLNSFRDELDSKHRLREVSDYVVISGHDASYLEVWSYQPDAFEVLLDCCKAANEAVSSNEPSDG